MSAPATTKNAPISKEAWTNFLSANKIDADEMLCALDVDRLSAWQGTLDQALAAFNNFVAIDKFQHDAEQAANAPTTPTSASNAGAPATDVPQTTHDATAGKGEPQSGHATVATTSNIIPLINIHTLTGINVLDIPARLNAHLPPEAYGAIKYGQMSGKTDVDGEYIRDRFDQVFGPMGIGWRITPNSLAGRVEHKTEERANTKGELKPWHIVTLVAHTFEYCVVQNGALTWVAASTTSDQHDNVDEQYAYRGALTSIMKQFYSLMGGMSHVRRDEYTHIHAAKELAQRGRKVS